MSSNVEVHAAKHEAFNNGDLDAVASLFAESATYTDHARGVVVRGRDEIKEYLAGWKRAFSDARCTEIRYLETEGATISRFIGRGTNDGPLGDLTPTGRSFAIPHCDIFQYDSHGRIVTAEHYYDQLSALQQLGHVGQPKPAPASRR